MWASYFVLLDAVVFLVDIADEARIAEAKDVLHQLFTVESLVNAPFLILANKIDLPTALSPSQVHSALELDKIIYDRNVHVAMVSLVKKQGVQEAFHWLGQQLKK